MQFEVCRGEVTLPFVTSQRDFHFSVFLRMKTRPVTVQVSCTEYWSLRSGSGCFYIDLKIPIEMLYKKASPVHYTGDINISNYII